MNVVNINGGANAAAVLDPKIQDSIVLRGDLSGLNENQKRDYYLFRCRQVGLDAAAKPFDLLTLNGKQILYANAGATQQLCAIHKLSTQITHRERVDGIYIVSVRCTGADGRVSENQGAVDVSSLQGERLANAILKATTKAIRRSVLAHCGLGMLDETEVETIPEARRESIVVTQDPAPIASEELPQDQVYEVPEQGIVFMVPGVKEAYDKLPNDEEWVAAYIAMIERIATSKKFNMDEKKEKIAALRDANSFIIEHISADKPLLAELIQNGERGAIRTIETTPVPKP